VIVQGSNRPDAVGQHGRPGDRNPKRKIRSRHDGKVRAPGLHSASIHRRSPMVTEPQ
jgi:hypothetical protein